MKRNGIWSKLFWTWFLIGELIGAVFGITGICLLTIHRVLGLYLVITAGILALPPMLILMLILIADAFYSIWRD